MRNESLEDSPIVNTFQIQDNSFPRINETWISKDEMRFDEPKPKGKEEDDIPYGSMDLGVDPNRTPKATQGESVVDKKVNTEVPEEETDHWKTKSKTVLRFGDPNQQHAEYVDPRLPKTNRRVRKLKVRPEEDL